MTSRGPKTGRTDPALEQVDELTRQLAALVVERDLAVARAREGGASWAQVASALGCSIQAAHKRYRWVCHSEHPPQVWFERPLTM